MRQNGSIHPTIQDGDQCLKDSFTFVQNIPVPKPDH
jgi:hypothetical protein